MRSPCVKSHARRLNYRNELPDELPQSSAWAALTFHAALLVNSAHRMHRILTRRSLEMTGLRIKVQGKAQGIIYLCPGMPGGGVNSHRKGGATITRHHGGSGGGHRDKVLWISLLRFELGGDDPIMVANPLFRYSGAGRESWLIRTPSRPLTFLSPKTRGSGKKVILKEHNIVKRGELVS